MWCHHVATGAIFSDTGFYTYVSRSLLKGVHAGVIVFKFQEGGKLPYVPTPKPLLCALHVVCYAVILHAGCEARCFGSSLRPCVSVELNYDAQHNSLF